MRVLEVRNASEALPAGLELLLRHGDRQPSRAGEVLVAPWPVTTAYARPRERLVLSPVRDTNPFFLLGELAWMLAGRDDSGFLDQFVRDFGARFADNGVVHGAYGARWRQTFGHDQLDAVVLKLRRDPRDRQAVLQMWDARNEVEDPDGASKPRRYGENDLLGNWRDRPCNTHVYLRVRSSVDHTGDYVELPVLDITVCCRSNDAVWGAYSSDAVDFSGLQEYLAARIGVDVGVYYQVSNNYHAYAVELDRMARRAGTDWGGLPAALACGRYADGEFGAEPLRLADDAASFDEELAWVLRSFDQTCGPGFVYPRELRNKFLIETLHPMLQAHQLWRADRVVASLMWAKKIASLDWQAACVEWLQRRIAARDKKRRG